MPKAESTIEKDLQTLELESGSPLKQILPQDIRNPFEKRKRSKSFPPLCGCHKDVPKVGSVLTFKHRKKKILRDPVLKLATQCSSRVLSDVKDSTVRDINNRLFGQDSTEKGDYDFRTIIQGYEQLSLANVGGNSQDYTSLSFRSARSSSCSSLKQNELVTNVQTSCSHQARMSTVPPCDVTINELASYFETFIHIPKKMSSMAEMMYI